MRLVNKKKEKAPVYCYWDSDRKNGEDVLKIIPPFQGGSHTPTGEQVLDFLNTRRLQSIKDQETYLDLQKLSANSKDYETAKWYSGIVRDHLKELRAIKLWLGYFGDTRKDTPFIEFWYWPTDLAPEIHNVAGEILLWTYENNID